MTNETIQVWGSAPVVKATEWCPACGREQSWDHPVLEIASPKDVTTEMIEYVDQVAHLDERDNIDWEATIDRLDGTSGNGGCWSFPLDSYEHPVFNKLKREVRKLRKGPE
jgi:tRNA uridine 5-carbamoylmethylation protein Kti12